MGSILLTGVMGSGKSAVGRSLATALSLPFVDLDQQVESTAGYSIATIFDKQGESEFRRLEQDALAAALATGNSVIALGGGALCSDAAWSLVGESDRVVWLRVTPDEAARRLRNETGNRPLLKQGDLAATTATLLEEREDYYARATIWLSTDGCRVPELIEQLVSRLVDPLPAVTVNLAGRSYDIAFSYQGAAGVAAQLAPRLSDGRAFVVSDSNVAALHLEAFSRALQLRGITVIAEVVPAGERSKSMTQLCQLFDRFLAEKGDRRTPVVALGGGVVGDLAGFAAASLLRGVPLIQVPTTVLAQVDSAVGGKTGINHAREELDRRVLPAAGRDLRPGDVESLPEREFISGLAEVVKYGAIADRALFELLEREIDGILRREKKILARIVRQSVEIKAAIVSRDERDQGERALLNYGHTLGHAIEAQSAYRSHLHGEAIAMGMVWINTCAQSLGVTPADDAAERVRVLLMRCGLPVDYTPYRRAEVVQIASRDKKVRGDQIELVLLEQLGKATRHVVAQDRFTRAALVESS